jgi:D-alanyl-D-alanine carboxypeptidase
LPIGGLTGTLADRFVETAPTAIGLVRAKTGTLNGTTNLAGFIESGDHEYNFVIISDQHNKSYTVTKRVRATVDRILGKIANPLLPEIPMLPPIAESSTVVTP